jgi:thiol-disulfide isomerase/thioredoxin
MRSHYLSIILLVVLCAALTDAQQIDWRTDYKKAGAEARETGKPLLLDFTAEWCKPCKVMETTFWVKPEIIKLSERFVCVKINFDSSKTVAAKFGVSGIPNIIVTDAWDTILISNIGFGGKSEAELIKKMSFVPADFGPVQAAARSLEVNKNEVAALYKFADFYQNHQFFFQSNEFNRRILKLEKDQAVRENLMLKMGVNYLKNNLPDEAIDVFENFKDEFPASPQLDKALYALVLANSRKGKIKPAQKLLAELKTKFPGSELVAEAEKAIAEQPAAKKK